MEPLLPVQGRAELSDLSADLLRKTGRLSGQVHSPVVRGKLAYFPKLYLDLEV